MTGARIVPGPLVSVVIPAHNAEATVAEAVTSVLAQTYRPIEVVVVDDGSTDRTWSVLQGFGDSIRAIHQENQGIGAARNASIRAASGAYLALMDADDICEPERIAVQMACLQALPDLVLCCTEFSAFNAAGQVSGRHGAEYYGQLRPERGGVAARYAHQSALELGGGDGESAPVTVRWGDVYEELALGNFVHPPTVLFRRELLDSAGWFDPSIRIMCEWDWLVRVARFGPIGFVEAPLLRYRLSAGQVSFSEEAPLDSVHVAEQILDRDPGLRARHPREARALMGDLYADAATAGIASHHRWAALRFLAKSAIRYGKVDQGAARLFLKILLPAALLELFRDLLEVAVAIL